MPDDVFARWLNAVAQFEGKASRHRAVGDSGGNQQALAVRRISLTGMRETDARGFVSEYYKEALFGMVARQGRNAKTRHARGHRDTRS